MQKLYALLIALVGLLCLHASSLTAQCPFEIAAQTTNVSCFGGANGSIDLTVTGGTPTYTYVWNNTSSQQNPTNLQAGTYTVTVTDQTGCSETASVTITQPTQLQLSIQTTNVSCFGGNNGTIDLTVTGGVPAYFYLWSNNATTQDVTNLQAGIYTITVTDQMGCTAAASATVSQPALVLATALSTNVSCSGGNNGSIDLTVTGGVPAYTYHWNDGGTTQDRLGLAAGIYCVTATDVNGCTATTCATITQPTQLSLASNTVPVTCFGEGNGQIGLTVAGGSPNYTFKWSNGANRQYLNGLPAGNYTVTVTDGKGCTGTMATTVNQPQRFQFTLNDKTDPACNQANGSINTYIEGGVLPYQFLWSNGATTEDQNNLPPGEYWLTATDANGCTASAMQVLNGVYVFLNAAKSPRCDDANSGSIDIQAFGGQSPYTFDWGGGITSEDRNNIPAGTYTVTLTDAALCTNTLAITVAAAKPVEIMLALLNKPCFGEANGKIKVDITNGNLPNYAYSWTCGSQSGSGITSGEPFVISKISEGTFKITVTNAGNCSGLAEVEIPVTSSLTATAESTKDPICKGSYDGEIRIKATGGTAPYQYTWSNGAKGNPVQYGKGTWTVTVSDANGCTTTASGILSDPLGFEINGAVTDEQCLGGNNGRINLTVTGSNAPFTYLWNHSVTTQNATGLVSGTYTVTVTDVLGCTGTKDFMVNRTPAFTFDSFDPNSTTDLFGYPASDCNSADGGIQLIMKNYTSKTVSYTWSDGSVSVNGTATDFGNGFDMSGVKTGVYGLTITDVSGCTAFVKKVTIPNATIDISLSTTNNTCSTTGSISAIVSNAVPPYTYTILRDNTIVETGSVQGNFTINNLSGGWYWVVIRDLTGCYATNSVQIQDKNNIVAIANVTPVGCNGLGAIDLTANGTGLTYIWSGGITTQDRSNLATGVYTVTITNNQGCTMSLSVNVPFEPNPVKTVLTPTAIDCAAGKGSILVAASGGTAPYFVTWTGGGQPQQFNGSFTIGNLSNGGAYWVTVTDSKGCTNSANTSVSWPPSLTMKTSSNPTTNCSSADGSVAVEMQSGVAPFTYQVLNTPNQGSGAGNNFTVNNLAIGQYTLRVTDAAGCSVSSFVFINAPAVVFDAVAVAPSSCKATDGRVLVSIQNGSGGPYGYSYFLNNQKIEVKNLNTSTFEITNLPANDNFNLTVFDGNCSANATICIPPNNILSLQTTVTNATCADPTGMIDLTVSGGKTPYTYDWNDDGLENPDNDPQDIKGLFAGSYAVIVTDANGCSGIATADVIAPTPPTATAIATPATCKGNDGSISLTISGGTAPFTFDWDHLLGSNDPEDPNGLSAGAYRVIITDANGCTAATQVFVNQANMFVVTHWAMASSNCVAPNGSATFDLVNGVANYAYSWTRAEDNTTGSGNDITTEPFTVNGLKEGVYIFTITDAIGCLTIRTIQVVGGMTASVTTTKTDCSGGPTGSTIVDITSNTKGPYTYNWSLVTANGTLTGSGASPNEPFVISNLNAGNCSITVTNGDGCTVTAFANIQVEQSTITLPAPVVKNVTCNGGNDGSIAINPIGGTQPYSYAWVGPNNFTSVEKNISSLVAGNYALTVKDNAGCTKAFNINVTQPTPLPVTVNATPITCFGGSNGSITLAVQSPQNYTFNWTGPNGFVASAASITGLRPGTYNYTVTQKSTGCTLVSSTILGESAQIIVNFIETQTTCQSRTYKVDVKNASGNPLYKWSDNTNANTKTFSQSGVYTVTVTDNKGCTSTGTLQVSILGANCSEIKGKVICDENKNCIADANEMGLQTFIVKATDGTQSFYGLSDANGNYKINVAPGAEYALKLTPPDKTWNPCPVMPIVNVANANQIVVAPDFPVQKPKPCPVMTVDITSSNLRRCFSSNYYTVKYCNDGTATAENAYIIVTLDAFMTPLSSSKPYTNLGNNQVRFDVGDVKQGECGTFNLYVNINCNAVTGQTHCSEAHVYPDESCEQQQIEWSGASLRVSSKCSSDSVRFVIKNVGIANMTSKSEYIVIEDVVMRGRANIQLNKGDSMIVAVPTNGSTWRLEVDQEDFHPGKSNPAKSVEGCSKTSTFSTGFVTLFTQDDQDKFIDIDCKESTAPLDPNDKQGYPVGYGPKHYLRPGTPIEYQIRFQNTGNDTAFTVVLMDTLSAWLDPTTIKTGAASHPYTWDLLGKGVLKFTFDNIFLPDSNVNQLASNGFVKYTIAPFASTPLDVPILNRAGIYFDFNPPIMTNYTEHRYGLNFIVSSLWQPVKPQYQVRVSPNPFTVQAKVELLGYDRANGDFALQVFDLQGKTIKVIENSAPEFLLQKGDLPAGTHAFRILESGKLIGSGKLMVH